MENKDENKKALTEKQLQNVTAGYVDWFYECGKRDNKEDCESEPRCVWHDNPCKDDTCDVRR